MKGEELEKRSEIVRGGFASEEDKVHFVHLLAEEMAKISKLIAQLPKKIMRIEV
jgi:hypothetical protein